MGDEGVRGEIGKGEPANDAEERLRAEIASLHTRVDRLERQLAVMVKRFSERLNDHGRRLDRVDEPPERRWFDR